MQFSMKGSIRTKEKCPFCGGAFRPVLNGRKDVVDLVCKTDSHEARPRYVYIDARALKAGKIYTNERGVAFDSFEVAHRQLEAMRREMDNDAFNPTKWSASRKSFFFQTEAEKWLIQLEKLRSIGHTHNSRSHVKYHLAPYFQDKDIREIRGKDIEDLHFFLMEKPIQERGRDLKFLEPKSIKNILGTLHACLKWFWQREEKLFMLPSFPVVSVPQKFRGWLNVERQLKVLSRIFPKHQLIFETLIKTAERPSETCAHKVKDLIDGELVVERAFDKNGNEKSTKANRVTYKALDLELWQKLQRHAEKRFPEDWLFRDTSGKPYTAGRLYKLWIKACEAEGIKIALVAGTRRSRASQQRLQAEKEVMEKVRAQLGHSNVSTTRHYARSRKEELK